MSYCIGGNKMCPSKGRVIRAPATHRGPEQKTVPRTPIGTLVPYMKWESIANNPGISPVYLNQIFYNTQNNVNTMERKSLYIFSEDVIKKILMFLD